jgi:hypothetical protein
MATSQRTPPEREYPVWQQQTALVAAKCRSGTTTTTETFMGDEGLANSWPT